jgi:hypothetical protein
MKTIKILIFTIILSNLTLAQKKYNIHTIAFYNLENLFDTKDDPNTFDEDFLPGGSMNWTEKNYQKKLDLLSYAISEIGTAENKNAPTILGVCEIENKNVLEDLVLHQNIIEKGYKIIHFDSPDRRGIDVGLLYQDKYFTPTSFINVPLYIYEDSKYNHKKLEPKIDPVTQEKTYSSKRIFTRDQLVVTGLLEGDEVHFIVNHWPSRSGGEAKSSPNREAAGTLNRRIIDSLYSLNPNAKIITMGDLNDGPYNSSVLEKLKALGNRKNVGNKELYNPYFEMQKNGIGTLAHRDAWDLFDQMIISEPLIRKDFSSFRYWKAGVFNKAFLTVKEGLYKGYPLRNANGEVGYSDHFPVYLYLIKEQN